MNDSITYIFNILTNFYFDKKDESLFAYISDENEFEKYKIVIRKSDFFDKTVFHTKKSLPALPLKIWENIPLLFGEPTVEKRTDTIILNADIIASSFFLLSRYEELINKKRDEHGRFLAKESLPFRAKFLHRPIVDEYGVAFRNLLRKNGIAIPAEKTGINKIYLTHDVDYLAHYRNIRSVLGAVFRKQNAGIALKTFFGKLENDPFYTFPFFFEQNKRLKTKDIEQIAFVLVGNKIEREDRTHYKLFGNDFRKFVSFCDENQVKIGLHTSYAAARNSNLIEKEKSSLEKTTASIITSNRNHYLCNIEPCDFENFINAGITDDFTMSYADIAGFRLGTCRNVRWINPENQKVTSLVLHPLTVMDGTLSDDRYMNLSENQAFDYVKMLIDNTSYYNGDLCLLWHNTSVVENSNNYHISLYKKIIDYLEK
ncbi:MAG: polysaccharide deacetylase family protein [Paludibacter sp.]|nr:polysaccharide deacetylase family protein [Paludibacter sp.]